MAIHQAGEIARQVTRTAHALAIRRIGDENARFRRRGRAQGAKLEPELDAGTLRRLTSLHQGGLGNVPAGEHGCALARRGARLVLELREHASLAAAEAHPAPAAAAVAG